VSVGLNASVNPFQVKPSAEPWWQTPVGRIIGPTPGSSQSSTYPFGTGSPFGGISGAAQGQLGIMPNMANMPRPGP
jgi:hypothetical protein